MYSRTARSLNRCLEIQNSNWWIYSRMKVFMSPVLLSQRSWRFKSGNEKIMNSYICEPAQKHCCLIIEIWMPPSSIPISSLLVKHTLGPCAKLATLVYHPPRPPSPTRYPRYFPFSTKHHHRRRVGVVKSDKSRWRDIGDIWGEEGEGFGVEWTGMELERNGNCCCKNALTILTIYLFNWTLPAKK